MKNLILIITLAALGLAQEKPAAPKEQQPIKMSDSAVAKIAKAQIKVMQAQRNLQTLAEQLMKLPQYQALEKAQAEAQTALNEAIATESKGAKAEGHEPDIEAGVWRKKAEIAKK